MPAYRYLAHDLMSGDAIASLPLTRVSFGEVLNGSAQLTASLPLGNDAQLNDIRLAATEPARTAIYVERDGVIVWGGIIWNRTYKPPQDLSVTAGDMWSYLKHRYIVADLTYTGTDQAAIASGIFDHAVSLDGSPSFEQDHALTGVTRDRSYYGYEGKEVGEAITQLSEVIDGPDFSLTSAWSAGEIVSTFRTHYPQRGLRWSETGYRFEWGRNIRTYDWPEDGSRVANYVLGFGSGEGVNMLRATAPRLDAIANGYPRLDMSLSNRDVSVQATLTAQAQAQVDARAYPVVLPTIEIAPDKWPEFGAWQVGDEALFALGPDPRFAERTAYLRRIIAYRMSVGDNGGERLTITTGLESG